MVDDNTDSMLSGGLLVVLGIIVAIVIGAMLFKDRSSTSDMPDLTVIEMPNQQPTTTIEPSPSVNVQMPAPNVNVQPAPDVNVEVPAPNVNVQPAPDTTVQVPDESEAQYAPE